MEWIFFISILFLLFDIREKIEKLNHQEKQKKSIEIDPYLKKNVNIILNEDNELNNDSLFQVGSAVIGQIIDYDQDWIIFQYSNKKNNIKQYIKITDIASIDEIK